MHEAAASIAAASLGIGREPFWDRAEAEQAIAAYRDLLHAMNRHGWQLFGSETRITGTRSIRNADARDVSAVRLVDELAVVGRRTPASGAQPLSTATSAWRAADVCVRTATDLLGTHRGVDGEWRSPQAQMLEEPGVRAVAFAELAALVIPVAEVSTHLGLRAGQVGIPWRQVERLLPPTESLLEVAVDVRAGAAARASEFPLRTIEVARPAIRIGDPVIELGDRLARLHRMAWLLTREDRVGVATLGDFAAAGVFVHERTSQLFRRLTELEPKSHPNQRQWLQHTSNAWRLIHLHVRELRSISAPMAEVRADVLAVRRLLDQVVAPAEHNDPAEARPLEAALVEGVRSFADVARWNAVTLDHLARSAQVYVPGRLLTGDEVTDHPVLVEAKLRDRVIVATRERINPLLTAYRTAQGTAAARGDSTPSLDTRSACGSHLSRVGAGPEALR